MLGEFNAIKSFLQAQWKFSGPNTDNDGVQRLCFENYRGVLVNIEATGNEPAERRQTVQWDCPINSIWREKLGLCGKTVTLTFEFYSAQLENGGLAQAKFDMFEKYPSDYLKTHLEITASFNTRAPQPTLAYEPLLTTNAPSLEEFLAATQYLIESKDLNNAGETEAKDAKKRIACLEILEHNNFENLPVCPNSTGTRIKMEFTGGVLSKKDFENLDYHDIDRGKNTIRRISKRIAMGSPVKEILAKKLMGADR